MSSDHPKCEHPGESPCTKLVNFVAVNLFPVRAVLVCGVHVRQYARAGAAVYEYTGGPVGADVTERVRGRHG